MLQSRLRLPAPRLYDKQGRFQTVILGESSSATTSLQVGPGKNFQAYGTPSPTGIGGTSEIDAEFRIGLTVAPAAQTRVIARLAMALSELA